MHAHAHARTHTPVLISSHFNLGPVTTMRLPTSDSKLFLFNEKKHPVFLSGKNDWRTKQKEEECGREGGTVSVQSCVCG